jgi:hypothetical protein
MGFDFDLTSAIRDTMVKEITRAHASGNFFYSKKFNSEGEAQAKELLLDAATAYDEHWIAFEIEERSLMKSFDPRETAMGEYSLAHVADSASKLYADGQFNRFYMIAVCTAASLQGKTVSAYQAQEKSDLKNDSAKLIGKIYDAEALKAELRSMKGTLNHELLVPHSGLSVMQTPAASTGNKS